MCSTKARYNALLIFSIKDIRCGSEPLTGTLWQMARLIIKVVCTYSYKSFEHKTKLFSRTMQEISMFGHIEFILNDIFFF